MSWDVWVEDERGKQVSYLGAHHALDRLWTEEERGQFPWLTSIDPTGDTLLNGLQRQHVARELTQLIAVESDNSSREDLALLLRWTSEVPDRHLYLRFAGE